MDEKVISIKTLAGEFDKTELQAYTNKQYIALQKAAARIQELELEVAHLKKVLSDGVPIIGEQEVTKIIVPKEQEICEIQIKILNERSLNFELTFEEVKKLETLVRTLKMIKEKPPTREGKSKSSKESITDAELVAIAAQPTAEEKEQ